MSKDHPNLKSMKEKENAKTSLHGGIGVTWAIINLLGHRCFNINLLEWNFIP